MVKKTSSEYFCVAVNRNYESVWRFVSKHATREEAEAELESRRAYTGALNYDNADLRVVSRGDAKKEFGPKWEYQPISRIEPPPSVPDQDAVPAATSAKGAAAPRPTRRKTPVKSG